MDFAEIVKVLNDFVWGPYMLVFLVGTGVFLTIRLKFLPWRNLGYAIKSVFKRQDKSKGNHEGDISPFQSLMTALSATIGTGNIVGVATAMVLGGPGALVWMWISALFGLSTKYAESVLAVKYRVKNKKGEMAGGPMYALKYGFKIKWLGTLLAVLFAIFAVCASFGIGNLTQVNSIAQNFQATFGVEPWIIGVIVVVLSLIVLVGGIKSIGKVCSILVPIMAVFYFAAGIIVIFMNVQNLPNGLAQIFSMAFSTEAVSGGVAGTVVLSAMRWGVARGVFSNEAGLGSAPIAAAAAKTDHPSRQGYVNMTGTFFDTIIVCTITGLAIAASGVLGMTNAAGEAVTGGALTAAAFSSCLGEFGGWIVTIGIALFAFSTVLGWEYYGEKSLEFLVNSRPVIYIYRIVFACMTYFGATTTMQMAWDIADTMNGLMAIPNLICLIVLSGVVAKECNDYQKNVIPREKKRNKKAQIQG